MKSDDTVIPDLQACVLCEDVRQELNGMQTLVGVINAIPAPVVPIRLFKLCLWSRWCSGRGAFHQVSRIIGPDQESIIAQSDINFEMSQIDSNTTNVHILGQLQFSEFGVHQIEILLDGDLRMRFQVPLIRIQGLGGG